MSRDFPCRVTTYRRQGQQQLGLSTSPRFGDGGRCSKVYGPPIHRASLTELGLDNNNERNVMNAVFRQGDVLIRQVEKIPEELVAVPLDAGRVILAYGEATGHAHAVVGDVELLAADVEEMEQRFLLVEAEAQVVHEEHSTITLPPGLYEVVGQREYTSADMEPIRVAD